jgi:PIN domain nuclease of toxin-antitoxin system
VLWLFSGSKRLPEDIREEIEYFQNSYAVSFDSIREIIVLNQLEKLDATITVDKIFEELKKANIALIHFEQKAAKILEDLPLLYNHTDPIDRSIIAQAIGQKYQLISSDQKFPIYRKFGLKLEEID